MLQSQKNIGIVHLHELNWFSLTPKGHFFLIRGGSSLKAALGAKIYTIRSNPGYAMSIRSIHLTISAIHLRLYTYKACPKIVEWIAEIVKSTEFECKVRWGWDYFQLRSLFINEFSRPSVQGDRKWSWTLSIGWHV